jgi:hypothetical protein
MYIFHPGGSEHDKLHLFSQTAYVYLDHFDFCLDDTGGIETTDTQHTKNSLLRKLLPLCYQYRIHLTCFDNLMKESRTSLVVQFLGNFKVS